MRRKILIITVLLLAITILFTVVNTVKAASTESEGPDSVVKVVDSNGTKYYADLNEALRTATSRATVTLLKPFKVDNDSKRVEIAGNKTLTFNFGGNTISSDSGLSVSKATFVVKEGATVTFEGDGGIVNNNIGGALLVTGTSTKVIFNGGTYVTKGTRGEGDTYSTVTVMDNATAEVNKGTMKNENGKPVLQLEDVTVNLNGGTISQTGKPKIETENYGAIQCTGGNLTVKSATITSGEGSGISVFGENTAVTINGGTITATGFAISGNGSGTTNSKITINGGNLTSTDTAAIYHPESGDLIVNGGTITGYYGIVSRQGTINVKGGDITAKGTTEKPVGSKRDVNLPLGAIVTDNNSTGYGSDTKVTITNGNFTGSIVEYNNEAKDDITVTGGSFDRELDEAYVKESLEVKKGDKYYLGDNAENVITEAKSGETLTILNGSADLKNIHNGVKVSNEGSGNVILNGQKVEKTQVEIINQTEQLADLKKQLADLKTKLEDEKVNLEQVRKELNELKDRVNSLEGDNKDLKDEIANLEAKLEKLEAEQNTSTQTTPETQKPNDETANEPTDETTDGNDVVNNKPTGELDDEPKTGDTYAISAGLVSLLSLVGAIVSKRFIK